MYPIFNFCLADHLEVVISDLKKNVMTKHWCHTARVNAMIVNISHCIRAATQTF